MALSVDKNEARRTRYRNDADYREKVKAQARDSHRRRSYDVAAAQARRRRAALDGYGGKCICCGESRYEFLAIDHVHGDGNSERKKYPNTRYIVAKVIREEFPPQYQVLCHNCNLAKGFYGSCPHEREANRQP